MELWIRNQNRETLELTTYLQIIYLDELDSENKWVIEGGSYLGYYKTQKRALEILDEIQNILKPKVLAHIRPSKEMVELLGGLQKGKTLKMQQDCEFKELSTYVYEMPEE